VQYWIAAIVAKFHIDTHILDIEDNYDILQLKKNFNFLNRSLHET